MGRIVAFWNLGRIVAWDKLSLYDITACQFLLPLEFSTQKMDAVAATATASEIEVTIYCRGSLELFTQNLLAGFLWLICPEHFVPFLHQFNAEVAQHILPNSRRFIILARFCTLPTCISLVHFCT